jgi:uncharacterized membrane protein YkoI
VQTGLLGYNISGFDTPKYSLFAEDKSMKRTLVGLVSLPLVSLPLLFLPFALCLLAGQLRADDETESKVENKVDEEEAAVHENARKFLPAVKLNLSEAITAALKSHAGGHAVEGGFEATDTEKDFVIEVAAGGKLYDVTVDAISGKVKDDSEVTDAADADEKAAGQAVLKSKTTLAKAVGAAIHALGGKGVHAFDAGAHVAEGKLIFEIGLLSGKDIYDVQVDGATGKVLAQRKAE